MKKIIGYNHKWKNGICTCNCMDKSIKLILNLNILYEDKSKEKILYSCIYCKTNERASLAELSRGNIFNIFIKKSGVRIEIGVKI